MNDNFYFSTDTNKYVPIKTNLDIRHTNVMNTSKKSDNQIGLVYNTDTSDYQIKSVPKHMKIIRNLNDLNNLKDTDFNLHDYYSAPSDTESLDDYYSDISAPSDSKSPDDYYSDYSDLLAPSNSKHYDTYQSYAPSSNIFRQKNVNNEFNADLLNDVNNSLSTLNTQVISICNKKNRLSNAYKNLVTSKIKQILNICS